MDQTQRNALSGELSAYLRQHADNPVHWQPFGDAAFAAAAARDVPVFLSIGYAACHWCHVMAHGSFEDPETAAFLNEHFVSVKVDREERPDVDAAYMAATQAISGEGGWPMSVFLTPEGRAFHAGTYYPPRPMPGRPSFRMVLEAVAEAWRDRRDAVEHSAHSLAEGLAGQQVHLVVDAAAPPEPLDADVLAGAVHSLAESEDTTYGGLGGAPKFPPSPVLEFLIRHAAGGGQDAGEAAGLAGRTLAAMVRSALFDQLAGGFARYSVTRDWSVPHFEKMLYDNAQLLRVLVHWCRLGPAACEAAGLPQQEAEAAASASAEWMISALRLEAGGFASSLDADTVIGTEHEEGATYLWSPEELRALLGEDDGAAVGVMMNISGAGTVTATGSALHPGRALDAEERRLWDRARPVLMAARTGRPQPARDEKVVAGWNGLAIGALADAGAILGRPDLVRAAEDAARYLLEVHLRDDGELVRVSHNGEARGIPGLLEDYAFVADGLFALYAAGGQERFYLAAEELIHAACRRFIVDGELTDVSEAAGQVRNAQGQQPPLEVFDNATPSGAAAFAGALLGYSAYSGSSEHGAMASGILGFVRPLAKQAPRVAGWALAVAEAAAAGPLQLAVVGEPGAPRNELLGIAWASPSPGLAVAYGDTSGENESSVPLLRGRRPGGLASAYLCRGMVCELPATSGPALAAQLAGRRS